jgi:hypothetical protein
VHSISKAVEISLRPTIYRKHVMPDHHFEEQGFSHQVVDWKPEHEDFVKLYSSAPLISWISIAQIHLLLLVSYIGNTFLDCLRRKSSKVFLDFFLDWISVSVTGFLTSVWLSCDSSVFFFVAEGEKNTSQPNSKTSCRKLGKKSLLYNQDEV